MSLLALLYEGSVGPVEGSVGPVGTIVIINAICVKTLGAP
jgi:hypothetical protein